MIHLNIQSQQETKSQAQSMRKPTNETGNELRWWKIIKQHKSPEPQKKVTHFLRAYAPGSNFGAGTGATGADADGALAGEVVAALRLGEGEKPKGFGLGLKEWSTLAEWITSVCVMTFGEPAAPSDIACWSPMEMPFPFLNSKGFNNHLTMHDSILCQICYFSYIKNYIKEEYMQGNFSIKNISALC